MAEGEYRSICTKGLYLFACSWLFFTVSRGNTVGYNNLNQSNWCHDIPEEVVCDNGPQFASEEIKGFTTHYGFHHSTSSHRVMVMQSVRPVKTVKHH